MCHLRIAENLIKEFPRLDEEAFVFGSLAPDSGIPNTDWTAFDPPKKVTHYLGEGGGEGSVQDMVFFREYLGDFNLADKSSELSFCFGYFLHLVCDRYWSIKINPGIKMIKENMSNTFSEKEFGERLRDDRYGVDVNYINEHPESLFWKVIVNSPIPQPSVSFIKQATLEKHISFIRKRYTESTEINYAKKVFPFFNKLTMDRFIADLCGSLSLIIPILTSDRIHSAKHSVIELFPEDKLTPYPLPLGDTN